MSQGVATEAPSVAVPSSPLGLSGRQLTKATAAVADAAAPRQRAATGRYYGWWMLPMAMAALVASSPGQTFGISIFNEPMRLSLGLSHSQLAAAYMLGTLLAALPISYIGYLMDRYGLRRTMLGVLTCFSAACLLTSVVQGWFMLVGCFFLLRMLGPGALSFLSGNTLSFWFERRLGMVEGLRQIGMAISMAIIPAFYLLLVQSFGWRVSYALLGLLLWCVLFPLFYIFFRDRPEDLGQRIDGAPHDEDPPREGGGGRENSSAERSAASPDWYWGLSLVQTLQTRAFWIVTAGSALYGLIHTAVFFCLIPIFEDRGMTSQHAAVCLTAFALSLALAQLAGGIMADRFAAPRLLMLGQVGLAGSITLLYVATTPAAALAAGMVMGISQGIYFGAAHPIWARYFGRQHLGKIRGLLTTLLIASSSLGPLIAGYTRDSLGSFDVALLVFALAPLPVALLSLLATPPPRPVRLSQRAPGGEATEALVA